MGDQNRPVTGYPVPPPPPPANSQPRPANSNGYSATATAGTAYPYANPNPYYNPYQYDPYATQRANLIRRVFAALIASVIIVGTIVFIVWLVLRPRLPEFRVDSLTLSNLNISSSTSLLSASWEARFYVHNPNKKITLFYDHIEAEVFYKSASLSETTLPPFYQDSRNVTILRATFAASGAYVDKWVVDGINSERSGSDQTVRLNVGMLARIRFKAGAWQARRRLLRIYCGDLGVRVSSNSSGSGLLVGGSKQCRVAL